MLTHSVLVLMKLRDVAEIGMIQSMPGSDALARVVREHFLKGHVSITPQ